MITSRVVEYPAVSSWLNVLGAEVVLILNTELIYKELKNLPFTSLSLALLNQKVLRMHKAMLCDHFGLFAKPFQPLLVNLYQW